MNDRLYLYYDKALLWLMLIFFAAHMVNHLAILWGADAHLKLMDGLRVIYRNPVLELLLVWAIVRQIMAGIRQMRRFGPIKSRGRFRVLVWSGIYLIGFMVIHLSAVALNRYVLNIDTNLYFATAGYRSFPVMLFFYPYYFLAVLSAFAHLGAVIWLRKRATHPHIADGIYNGSLVFGLGYAALLTVTLSGLWDPFAVPDEYFVLY